MRTLTPILSAARRRLETKLSRRAAPLRQPLSADLLLCASCLRLGLSTGDSRLALGAAATLLAFGSALLWPALGKGALESRASSLDLLEELVAAFTNREWRRRMGSEWGVVAILIEDLCKAPVDRSNLSLGRLLDHFHTSRVNRGLPPEIAELVQLAQQVEWSFSPNTPRMVDDQVIPYSTTILAELAAKVGWVRLDMAEMLWRLAKTHAAPAFAVGIDAHMGKVRDISSASKSEASVQGTIPGEALTHETPGGYAFLRAWLEQRPEVALRLAHFEAVRPIEVLGRFIARIDEEAWWGTADPLSRAARVAGLGIDDLEDAARFGKAIDDHFAGIAKMRSSYLPTPTFRPSSH